MSELITLELPEDVAQRARAMAAASHRNFEAALTAWITQFVTDPPIESLSDAELLTICNDQLPQQSQMELSGLLDRNRESQLNHSDQIRLDQLLNDYRSGLVRKARAIREAVARGLRPGLNNDAA